MGKTCRESAILESEIVGPMMRMIEKRKVSHDVAMGADIMFAVRVAARIANDKDSSFFNGFNAADSTKESIRLMAYLLKLMFENSKEK